MAYEERHSSSSRSSSYEEAIKRSNERMNKLRNRSIQMDEMQQSLRYDADDPRALRYEQRARDAANRPQHSARPRNQHQPQYVRRDVPLQRERYGYGNGVPRDQVAAHRATPDNYRARQTGSGGILGLFDRVPVKPRMVVAAVLLVICLVLAFRISPATARIQAANDSEAQTEEQISDLESANNDLTSTLDSMDATISAYSGSAS